MTEKCDKIFHGQQEATSRKRAKECKRRQEKETGRSHEYYLYPTAGTTVATSTYGMVQHTSSIEAKV